MKPARVEPGIATAAWTITRCMLSSRSLTRCSSASTLSSRLSTSPNLIEPLVDEDDEVVQALIGPALPHRVHRSLKVAATCMARLLQILRNGFVSDQAL
jgi:hypothetical protein